MSTDTDIRTTLRRTVEATDVPFIDEAGFERRVRRHRNRRRSGVVGAVAAAAAAVLAVPLAVSQIDSDPGSAPPPFAAVGPRPAAYFVLGARAVMLDGDGELYDLDVRAEAVIGPTDQGVLILSRESRLVHVRVSESDRGWTFDRVEAPTTRPVQSAAVSADGSRVAVVDLEEDLVVYDLGGDELSRTPNVGSAYVADFSDRVLYAVGDDTLRFGMGPDAVEIPVFDGPAWDSAAGGNVVAVSSHPTTRIYDVADGSAVEIAELPGRGDLSPDGRYYVAGQEDTPAALWDGDSGEQLPLSGLDGPADQLRWLDQDTFVAGSSAAHGELYACEASTQRCERIFEHLRGIWLER
jgi:hypothetical protein